MAGMHKWLPVFRLGSIRPLLAERHRIAYGRMYRQYHGVVIVSNSPDSRRVEVPVWQLGITDDMVLGRPMLTVEEGYNAGIMMYHVRRGLLTIEMPAHSAAVLISRPEDFYPVVNTRFADEPDL